MKAPFKNMLALFGSAVLMCTLSSASVAEGDDGQEEDYQEGSFAEEENQLDEDGLSPAERLTKFFAGASSQAYYWTEKAEGEDFTEDRKILLLRSYGMSTTFLVGEPVVIPEGCPGSLLNISSPVFGDLVPGKRIINKMLPEWNDGLYILNGGEITCLNSVEPEQGEEDETVVNAKGENEIDVKDEEETEGEGQKGDSPENEEL